MGPSVSPNSEEEVGIKELLLGVAVVLDSCEGWNQRNKKRICS